MNKYYNTYMYAAVRLFWWLIGFSFIYQGYIKLIKSDTKHLYNIAKNQIQVNAVPLNF